MNRPRLAVVYGTRPEAIKMAPVIGELRRHADLLETIVVSTGQHREMLVPVLELFGIVPDLDLGLMRPAQTLDGLTAEALVGFGRVLDAQAFSAVLVQGDTTTAMACALASFYRKVPVGHVEAGLRTGDRFRPFPEEVNRRLITAISRWNFAPTRRACDALLAEGIPEGAVHLTGNTVIDALNEVLSRPERPGEAPPFPGPGKRLVLVTAHRRESFGPPFEELCLSLRAIAEANTDVDVVYPVHLNPSVQEPVNRILGGIPGVHLIPPLGYLAFARLMQRARLILTDSGGIQEEAPTLRIPILVLREETERPEALEAGVARLVGTNPDRVVPQANLLLRDDAEHRSMAHGASPFGDGHAAGRIVRILLASL